MIFYICCILSVLMTAGTAIGFPLLQNMQDIWKLPLLWVGYLIGLVLLYILFLLIVWLIFLPQKKAEKGSPLCRFLMEYTLEILMILSRVKCRVIGKEKLPDGRFLLVSNHISNYDPLVFLASLHGTQISFVSKPENFRIPIVNVFMRHCRFLPIDRENPRNAVRTINEAAEMIRNDEASIGIYPEGTRSKNGQLQEFKNGAFKIAMKAKAPIVVVRLSGTNQVGKNFPWRRTEVTIDIRKTFSWEELNEKNSNEISELVRRQITGEDN